MRLVVNIEKRYAYAIIGLLIIVGGIFAINAYTTPINLPANPAIFGHSVNELEGAARTSATQRLDGTGACDGGVLPTGWGEQDFVCGAAYARSMLPWTPALEILGTLPITAMTKDYPIIPPATAKEVLVYIWAQKGAGGGDKPVKYIIYTTDGTNYYSMRFHMYDYNNGAYNTNSDNFWLPITSDKKIHVTSDNTITGLASGVQVIGYR